MKLVNIVKKINLKNIIVMVLIVIVHLVTLFSSPFFLGPTYSKTLLIDEFCKSNLNGNSIIISSTLNKDLCSYQNILDFQKNNDSEFNTITGLGFKNAVSDEITCNLISAKASKIKEQYNTYRVYSDYGWNRLEQDNYIYIPESMVPQLVSDPKRIVDEEVDICIDNEIYTFKIGGSYNASLMNSEWRSRGYCFNESFQNCIFVSETFLSNKFNCAFEMITSNSADSGHSYEKFKNMSTKYGATISEPKNSNEIKLLNGLALLDKTKRNKILQTVFIVLASLLLSSILIFSIIIFDVCDFGITKRGNALFVWGLLYYAFSCVFLLIIRNKVIDILGFSSYGANKALLSILLLFFIIFFAGVSLKTFIKNKKEQLVFSEDEKNTKGDIIFVTKAKFPNNNAFATYIGSVASVYKNAGYSVTCIGNGYSQRNTVFESYFGKYISLRNTSKSFISKVASLLFFENKVCRYLENNFKKPSHIFFSCEFSLDFYRKVKRIYSDADVKYSFILTEEYTKDEFEQYNLLAKNSLKVNKFFVNEYYNKDDSFITISRHLFNKIENRKMKCVYVPFCFNIDYISSIKKKIVKHKELNYIYCGSPENKDLLPVIVEAFSSLPNKEKVHLNIIGVDDEWAMKHGVNNYDKSIITFFGRNGMDFIVDKYSESDYSVLLRDENKLFAKAGFPTKISESMVFGIVPITNLSSNLSDYLNENNSIIVNGHTKDDFIDALNKSISEAKKITARKKNAFLTASTSFNIDSYKNELLSLLENK